MGTGSLDFEVERSFNLRFVADLFGLFFVDELFEQTPLVAWDIHCVHWLKSDEDLVSKFFSFLES